METRMRRTTGGHVWFSFTACLLVMLSVVSTSRAALTANEKAALGQILTAYPDLMIVPPWASTTADGKYHGKAWSFGFDAVCNSPGYDLYGIHCSDQGHVDGLEVNSFWGAPTIPFYDNVDGLTYLRNVSTTETSCELVEELIRQIPLLENLEIPWLIPAAIVSHSGITRLSATEHSNLLFNSFTSLKHLHVQSLISPTSESFSALKHRLESLSFGRNARFYVSLFASLDISSYSVLKRLEFSSPLTQEPSNTVTAMSLYLSTLETLSLHYQGSDMTISITGPNLRTVTLEGWTGVHLNGATVQSLALSVSILSAGNLSSLPLLEELTVSSLGQLDLPLLPLLKKVGFRSHVPNDFLCSYVHPSLLDLELSSVDTVPDCLLQATSLKRLHISNIGLIDSSTFTNMPTSVENLLVSQGYDSASWPVEELLRFSNLIDLSATGFRGPLPSDFLVQFPQLVRLFLASSGLTGAVPSRGWENLERVNLIGMLTSFPGIEGTASRLKGLCIEFESELATIPADDVMLAAQLDNLESVFFYVHASGPLPTFWTHLPKIRHVVFESDLFTGPLPTTIRAPLLTELSFQNSPNLCGPLFDFEVPTKLSKLILADTKVSGPFPASWNSKLKTYYAIFLSGNYLTGSLPQNWFTTQTKILEIHDNPGLTGPFAFHKGFRDFWELKLSNTNLSLCGPPISTATTQGQFVSCMFENLACPAAGTCAQYWDNFCTTNLECGGTPPPYIAPPTCTAPPPRPNAFASPPTSAGETIMAIQTSFLIWLPLSLAILPFF